MLINQVAAKYGVTTRTLRYYESLVKTVLVMTSSELSLLTISKLIEEQVYLKDDERQASMFKDYDDFVVEFGEALIPYAEDQSENGLIKNIKRLRIQLASSNNIKLGLIRVKDNMSYRNNQFTIKKKEVILVDREVDLGHDDPVNMMINQFKKLVNNKH